MATKRKQHDVADLGLAGVGESRIAWADGQMPVLRQIRARFEEERPLDGVTIGCCLHVTAETANLARTLAAGGADVGLCASNPLSTQDDVAAALVENYGMAVFAIQGEDPETYYAHIDAVCDRHPRVTMDDGADLISVLHDTRSDQLAEITGGTENTTTGVIRVRALEAQGKLAFPVIAVDDAATKHLVDNRYGTGQSTLDGILRSTNALIAGRRVVVVGYGACGEGVAERAKGAGARVIVCEVNPLRALEAALDGYDVMPALEAAACGDLFVTVTGNRDVLTEEHFAAMKDGAILANAGHFDVEIDKASLDRLTKERRAVRPHVEEHALEDGRRLLLLAEGRVVNLAAAEGNPASVMDISFANQALAAEHLVLHGRELEAHVQQVPPTVDEEIARLKLEALGVAIDELTDEQRAYLNTWELGT
jgi:adenosylhomocysteinase